MTDEHCEATTIIDAVSGFCVFLAGVYAVLIIALLIWNLFKIIACLFVLLLRRIWPRVKPTFKYYVYYFKARREVRRNGWNPCMVDHFILKYMREDEYLVEG